MSDLDKFRDLFEREFVFGNHNEALDILTEMEKWVNAKLEEPTQDIVSGP